jgi:primosomal replication protein N
VNEVRLDGVLVERAATRHTPAGVPVVEARIQHRSDVMEAGASRSLEFVVNAVALGPVAGRLEREALGAQLDLSGFLAPRSRRSSKLVLHVTGYHAKGS